MATCPKCQRRFKTLPDEAQQHACACGFQAEEHIVGCPVCEAHGCCWCEYTGEVREEDAGNILQEYKDTVSDYEVNYQQIKAEIAKGV